MSAYATITDIAARLARDLTTAEEMAAMFLIEAASEVINIATEEPDPDPEPAILRFVCVELVIRALANPQGLANRSETIGAYSHSESFRKELSSDLVLTKTEELMVRRAVHGRLSGTAQQESVINDPDVIDAIAPRLGWYGS